MPDVIICANFGVEKLRGLGNTRGQILGSPIDMAGHPYNSAALPRRLWLIAFNSVTIRRMEPKICVNVPRTGITGVSIFISQDVGAGPTFTKSDAMTSWFVLACCVRTADQFQARIGTAIKDYFERWDYNWAYGLSVQDFPCDSANGSHIRTHIACSTLWDIASYMYGQVPIAVQLSVNKNVSAPIVVTIDAWFSLESLRSFAGSPFQNLSTKFINFVVAISFVHKWTSKCFLYITNIIDLALTKV